jgi:glycosyltransferase involved in cell wall biosynthesis
VKVAYVSPHAQLGGAERVTLDLIELHQRALVTPSVVFLRDGPLVRSLTEAGVEATVIEAPRLRRLLAVRSARAALTAHLRASGADLVHAVMAWGQAFAGKAARKAGIPSVWYQHGVPDFSNGEDLLAALSGARRILANSEFTASRQRRFNPRRTPIEVVQPGTRLPAQDRSTRRERGRLDFGLHDGQFVVGMVARLVPGKGHQMLLRAARSLCAARSDAHVLVAGSGAFGQDENYPQRIRDLALELGLERRVSFLGEIGAVQNLLSACDVAVHLPDGSESYGLAAVEAQAAGTAVVATRGGAIAEIVVPGRTALLVPRGDHEALAAALLSLHDDPEACRRMGTAGEAHAREHLDARAMTRRVEELYREVLKR